MLNVLRAISLGAIAITLLASAPAKPSFALLLTGGSASEKHRAYADGALIKALRARGFVGDAESLLDAGSPSPIATGRLGCERGNLGHALLVELAKLRQELRGSAAAGIP